MMLTVSQLQSMLSAVEAFPVVDVEEALSNPSAKADEQVVLDVLSVIAQAYPQAALAALAFEAIIWAIEHPAINEKTNADPLGRGGRRA